MMRPHPCPRCVSRTLSTRQLATRLDAHVYRLDIALREGIVQLVDRRASGRFTARVTKIHLIPVNHGAAFLRWHVVDDCCVPLSASCPAN